MRLALTPNVVLVTLVASALAAEGADLPAPPVAVPVAPVLSPWNAFYVGGFLGASATTQNANEQGANQFFAGSGAGTSVLALPTSDPETTFGFDGNRGSFTAGGFAGATYQYNELVFGAETDFAWKQTDLKASQATGGNAIYIFTPFNCGADCDYDTASATRAETFTGQVQQKWDASVRARLGTLVAPGAQVYVTAGGAAAQVQSSFSYLATTVYSYENAPGAPPPITHTTAGVANWNDILLGWTVGGGFEALLTRNWRVRAEYRFTDFGQFSKQLSMVRSSTDPLNLPNTGSANSTVNFNAAFHTVRIGLAYAF